jgi:muramoyltetrapeptide carboxypeptidase
MTFSGPMLAGNFGAPELDAFTQEHFWRALRNPTFSIEWQGNGPDWECEGLWGGNLAMLVSLIGTPWLPDIDDGILVLEDINEHPFRSSECCCSFIMPVFLRVSRSCWAV